MCNDQYSESGTPIAPTRCAEYGRLKAENEVLRDEIAALKAQLADFHAAVQHVTEDGNTTRSYSTSDGWAMVHKDRLLDLLVAEEENARLRRALDILGVPAQAKLDPGKAPPLRITVDLAQRAMKVADGEAP